MSIFNNVEIYFSIIKKKWRSIRYSMLPLSIQELLKCMVEINLKKKWNIKKHWVEALLKHLALKDTDAKVKAK